MAQLSWLKLLYWKHFSKPVSERALFLHVLEKPLSSILEIGMGSGERITRLLDLNASVHGTSTIRYTAIDPFESRSLSGNSAQPVLSLKTAHRLLSERGVKAHLVPGEPANSLARVAHSVLPSDLVLIDGNWDHGDMNSQAIAQWLPRLCHVQSSIFVAKTLGESFVKVPVPSNSMPVVQTKAA
ncbi:MAG: hypothetical protein ACKOAU_01090 [Pirellula sp.]|jgi:hypothetical protein